MKEDLINDHFNIIFVGLLIFCDLPFTFLTFGLNDLTCDKVYKLN